MLPTQVKVDGNLIVDQKSAEIALNGAYYRYAVCGLDNYNVPTTSCFNDFEIYPAQFGGVLLYYQGAQPLESHALNATSYYASGLWFDSYQSLYAANGVISQMEAAPDGWFQSGRKTGIIGEARLLRAFTHYNLLRWFAQYYDYTSSYGALIRNEVAVTGNIAKDRSTVKESYDAVLQDIDYAIEHCPESNAKYYLNKWVAKGLKARVLMMRGQSGDYAQVVSLTTDILSNSPYQLEDKLQDIFYLKGLESQEVMFGIQPKEGQTRKMEAYYYRNVTQFYPTEKFLSLFDNDPRREWLFTNNLITKYLHNDNPVATLLEEVNYQMRLTEFYLLKAEALVLTGGDKNEVRALLKDVMATAGITDLSAVDKATSDNDLLSLIFEETLKNLFCESGRELEIMMRMPKSIVQPFNSFCDAPDVMILPIPAEEFKQNPVLSQQNPGYSKE
jgi:hypothetical protein